MTLLSALVSVKTADWNYLKHGSDWGSECVGDGVTNQSPINLVSPDREYFNYTLIEGVEDEVDYKNLNS